MNVDEVYKDYLKKGKRRKYDINFAEFKICQVYLKLNMALNYNTYYLLKDLQHAGEYYLDIYSKNLIEYVLEYVQEKNNQ